MTNLPVYRGTSVADFPSMWTLGKAVVTLLTVTTVAYVADETFQRTLKSRLTAIGVLLMIDKPYSASGANAKA